MAKFVRARPEGTPEEMQDTLSDWPKVYPAIWEFLTLFTLDGKPRVVSTLTMFVDEDQTFKACLNDRHEGRSCFTSGVSPEVVLDRLELSLQDGTADWRRPQGARRRS